MDFKFGKYKHYKGAICIFLGIARHSETLEELVVYQHLGESEFGRDALWVRPKKMFLGTVSFEGKEVQRFEFVEE